MVLPWTGRTTLLEPYHFCAAGVTGTVPAGFDLDGLSVPRIFRPLVEPYGFYIAAAAPHDWLYFLAGRTGIDREQSDRVLLEICLAAGGTVIPRQMHNAVRIGGRSTWEKYAQSIWDDENAHWLASGGSACFK